MTGFCTAVTIPLTPYWTLSTSWVRRARRAPFAARWCHATSCLSNAVNKALRIRVTTSQATLRVSMPRANPRSPFSA